MRRAPGGFIEHTMSEEAFAKLPNDRKLIVVRYGIPLPVAKGFRKFKITRTWFRLAFPERKDED